MSQHLEAVVVGLGEVGLPLYRMLYEAYEGEVRGYDVKPADPEKEIAWALPIIHTFDFMHICFPQTTDFVDNVSNYIYMFKPRYVIIHSTLSIGMTEYLQQERGKWHDDDQQAHYTNFFYSPIRGNTRDGMAWCLRTYTKYVSGLDSPLGSLLFVKNHLAGAGFTVKEVPLTSGLEMAKLWDLAWYGVNIAFYQELERNCDIFEYKTIREFIESTPIESEGRVPRVVLYGGHIGGHCVIQGIEKLLAEFDIMLLGAVVESNIRREKEVIFHPERVHGKGATIHLTTFKD